MTPATGWRRTDHLLQVARTSSTLDGRWSEGHVHGQLIDTGGGAGLGCPALVLDPDGPVISVQVFESMDLPDHWSRLDDFDGPGYQRVVTTVHTPAGAVAGCSYVLRVP